MQLYPVVQKVSCYIYVNVILKKKGYASLGGYDSDSFYNVFMSLSVKSANCEWSLQLI